jgi:hypothetical protein
VATVELRVRWGLSWGAMTTNSYHRRSGGGVTVSWYGETEDESEEKEAMAADTWQAASRPPGCGRAFTHPFILPIPGVA